MQASTFWQRFIGTVESGDLDDLRRDMILEISAAIFVIGWILMVTAIGYDGRLENLPVALILLTGSLGSIWLRSSHFRIALWGLILTPISAIACCQWFFPDSLVQYYFPVAVVVSSLLVSNLSVLAVATLAGVACLIVTRWQGIGWWDGTQVITPLILIYLTAFAAWLGSRQIHMALGWMQNSYARVRDLLEQLRDERMSLARMLKALEEAYVRIEKMNYALIEARGVAEEARRLKAEFAANVSHELRTPLNIIIGFSETMANAPETYTGVTWSPALRGDIEQIYQSSRHLSSLIDDILDLSALEVRRLGLTIEEADIQTVIEEAVAVVHDLFRAKELYLRIQVAPDLPRLRLDATRIRQVLINLLTNASRFTTTGGVTITAHQVEQAIQVAVTDTGVGIAPQDVAKVFEDFGQVDGSTSRRHEGTGLGVPLSKRLVELHGGRMWLESQVGQGTTVYFTLPIFSDAPPLSQSVTTRVSPASLVYRKSLLALEPDPLLLRTIRRQLSSYDVIAVTPEADLPALVNQHQPLALIVDRQVNGETVIPQTWQAAMPPDLPVITVSLPGNLRCAQALGIEGFLFKPVQREQLLDAIECLNRPIRHVLIVDDDAQLVELFGRMLQSAGEVYHPIKAFGGEDALNLLRRQPIDLVLLDLLMPGVDGLTVLREMKADPALAGIPVIVISGQYPETIHAEGHLSVELTRPQSAAIGETLNYLAALVSVLPVRGLPEGKTAPGSSTTPHAPPVS